MASDEYLENAKETVAHFYAAAKWILGVFAAVAVLLLAGTQLSSIGRLPVSESVDRYRFLIALASVLTGLASTSIVIWSTVSVLQTGRSSIEELKDLEARDQTRRRFLWHRVSPDLKVIRELSTLVHYSTPTMIRDWDRDYHDTINQYRTFPEPRSEESENRLNTLLDDIKQFEQARLRVLATVKADQVRRKFRRSLFIMFFFGLATSAAIVGFAWAANPPPISASAIIYPSTATLTLSPAEQAVLSSRIGSACVANSMKVIILDKTNDQYDVVTIPTGDCTVLRFMAGNGAIGTLRP